MPLYVIFSELSWEDQVVLEQLVVELIYWELQHSEKQKPLERHAHDPRSLRSRTERFNVVSRALQYLTLRYRQRDSTHPEVVFPLQVEALGSLEFTQSSISNAELSTQLNAGVSLRGFSHGSFTVGDVPELGQIADHRIQCKQRRSDRRRVNL